MGSSGALEEPSSSAVMVEMLRPEAECVRGGQQPETTGVCLQKSRISKSLVVSRSRSAAATRA